jgi:hypothetical protein
MDGPQRSKQAKADDFRTHWEKFNANAEPREPERH